jgi:hypothetical protein
MARANPKEHGGAMCIQNEPETAGAAAREAKLSQIAGKPRDEDAVELDAIEDDEVRQILKIPPRHKLPKLD